MPRIPGGVLPPVPIEFNSVEWQEEVDRYALHAPARIQAERARKEIEAGRVQLIWHRCQAAGPMGTNLPGCRKLYIPIGMPGASDAPFGFVFQLIQKADRSLAWNMIAFGERHPVDRKTRTVYERAHKRLHGHYPS